MIPLAAIPAVAGGIAAVGDLAIDAWNAWKSHKVNQQNVQMQREAWSREDSAIQRRVADLKAAGMNPVLAAGSAAGSSGPIRLEAPRMEAGLKESAAVVMNLMRQQADIAQTLAQKELIQAQRDLAVESYKALPPHWMRKQAEENRLIQESEKRIYETGKSNYETLRSEVALKRDQVALSIEEDLKRVGVSAGIAGPLVNLVLKALGR